MKIWVFIWILLLSNGICFAQTETKNNTEKLVRYQYNMDEYFSKNRKLIRHLDTIIPVIFKELNNSRTCDDKCDPDYKLELMITPFRIIKRDFAPNRISSNGRESYQHITTYSFPAYFILRNKENKAIKYFDIIDSPMVFEYKTKHLLNTSDRIMVPYYVDIVNPSTGRITRELRYREDDNSNRVAQNPIQYFKSRSLTDPTEREVFNEVESALLALHVITKSNGD